MNIALIIISWIVTLTFARLLERTWWAPGSLLALIFGVSAIGTEVFAPEYYESLPANMFLQGLVLATVVGSVLGHVVGRRDIPDVRLIVTRRITFIAFGFAFSMVALVATFQVIEIPVSGLVSPISIMRTAQAATKERYTTGFDFPIYYNIANAFVLTYAVIAAAHFTATRSIDKLMLVPLLIFGFANLLITTRSPILFLLILMALSSAYSAKLLTPDREFVPLFSPRYLKLFAIGAFAIIGIFFFFQILRFGENSDRGVGEIWFHLRRWPWGSLPGFSLWYDGLATKAAEQPAGFFTFMGLYDNLGIAPRIVGGYREYVYLTPGEPGNIYTAFRGMVLDFGEVGTFLAMGLIGFLGGVAARGRFFSPIVSMAIYIGVMTFISFSFVVSAWSYSSNVIALIMLPVLLPYFTGRVRVSMAARAKYA